MNRYAKQTDGTTKRVFLSIHGWEQMLFYPETDRPRQRGEESRAGSSEMGSEQIPGEGPT